MSIIGNNKNLNSIQQLCYLKGCQKGEAKRLESAQDTCKSLHQSLKERYDNKRAVLDCLIKLLNFSRVPASPSHLMQLINNTKCYLCALKLLEFESNKLSDTFMMNILFQKLDSKIKSVLK